MTQGGGGVIQKMTDDNDSSFIRLLYLKYILEEDDTSLLSKFFKVQLDFPTKGDWASTCMNDMKELNINNSLEEIKMMSKTEYTKILKENCRKNAFKYLIGKKGSKGKEIIETELCMAEYLLPTTALTICEKQQMFAVKNRMKEIPANFSKSNIENKCICEQQEDMKHIYQCKLMNNGEEPEIEYEKIFEGDIWEQIKVFKKFERNLEKRRTLKDNQKKN